MTANSREKHVFDPIWGGLVGGEVGGLLAGSQCSLLSSASCLQNDLLGIEFSKHSDRLIAKLGVEAMRILDIDEKG